MVVRRKRYATFWKFPLIVEKRDFTLKKKRNGIPEFEKPLPEDLPWLFTSVFSHCVDQSRVEATLTLNLKSRCRLTISNWLDLIFNLNVEPLNLEPPQGGPWHSACTAYFLSVAISAGND